MEMLSKEVEALETQLCETWDAVFNAIPGVHRAPDSGSTRMVCPTASSC